MKVQLTQFKQKLHPNLLKKCGSLTSIKVTLGLESLKRGIIIDKPTIYETILTPEYKTIKLHMQYINEKLQI